MKVSPSKCHLYRITKAIFSVEILTTFSTMDWLLTDCFRSSILVVFWTECRILVMQYIFLPLLCWLTVSVSNMSRNKTMHLERRRKEEFSSRFSFPPPSSLPFLSGIFTILDNLCRRVYPYIQGINVSQVEWSYSDCLQRDSIVFTSVV